ncbi:hypothetical protein AY586_12235 [Marichromatium gracile]|uniref:DDE superfamily endonuclease n=1 Tax=Marichromatium gracile TaxID=1048 RepID=A0ABR5VG98_MARGR|nr:hypothetical protein AY586_12235 [Marichromatium gracile]
MDETQLRYGGNRLNGDSCCRLNGGCCMVYRLVWNIRRVRISTIVASSFPVDPVTLRHQFIGRLDSSSLDSTQSVKVAMGQHLAKA